MKALYYNGEIAVIDTKKPVLIAGEAVIRVSMAGLCATDREIFAGYMNFRGIPGHEFAGVVEECADGAWIGKRVTGEINAGCGDCDYCRRGLERHCPKRTTIGIAGRDGAFAEYLSLPVGNLVELPDCISDEEAVFIEPLAAVLEITEQIRIEPDWRILIVGDGKLAALTAMVLRLHGLDLTVSGIDEAKLDFFRGLGLETVTGVIPADSFDLVIEASGSPNGWESAVSSVKPRGTIVLKSTYHDKLDFNPAPIVIKEITLIGSRCGRFKPAVRLIERGLVEVKPLISKVFSFEDIQEAINYSRSSECLKVLIRFPAAD
ncbi:MAG: alcohol dehydrogenase catalytic domain-containing protein [FCB group bacterium]|nr:alcohol dehydrogenase catalytic domain-containing protein [FCB group bacterium]